MTGAIPEKLLGRLSPLNELDAGARLRLSEKAHVDNLQAGTRIKASDEYKYYVYLIDGMLELNSKNKSSASVDSGTSRAQRPLFTESQISDVAIAKTPVLLARIERQLFEVLSKESQSPRYDIVDVQVSGEESEIFQQIYLAYHQQELELPSMPEVALRIRRVADDVDADVKEIARIIQMDPTVTGGFLQAANSPMYRAARPITKIKDAIIRIGLNGSRTLATTLAMRNIFKSRDPRIKALMHAIWKRSIHVSALSFVIAKNFTRLDPELALLAGLMHAVGAVPILTFAGRRTPPYDPRTLDGAIEHLQAMTGLLVLDHWGLNDAVRLSIEESGYWFRDRPGKADICDVVLVARLFSELNTARTQTLPRPGEVPAGKRLALKGEGGLDPRILKDAKEEIESIRELLKGTS